MDAERAEQRRIIVGLGNPGRQYADNRHNVGFQLVDALARKHGLAFNKMMNRGIVALGEMAGRKVALVKPQTFMNDSGACVGPLVKFYKTEPANVLVVYDELDLPLATLRMRKDGGHGGHNGMRSVIAHMGTSAFPRLRVGIGRPPGRKQPAAHVLEAFDKDELVLMNDAFERAADGIARWLIEGPDNAMNVINAPVANDPA